jgi:hypothetical protein
MLADQGHDARGAPGRAREGDVTMRRMKVGLAVCIAAIAMAGCGGADTPAGGQSAPNPDRPAVGKARFSGEFTGYDSRKDRE